MAGEGREFHAFPLETSFEEMQRWRASTRARMALRRSSIGGHAPAGTFARDVQRYLNAVTAMPDYKGRVYDMERWTEAFGGRRSLSIASHEIRAQRDQWLRVGPKWRYHPVTKVREQVAQPLAQSTVNHRLRALENFFTVMFPREANPVRDVPEADEPEAMDRSIPYTLIEMILSAMPDRGQGKTGEVRREVSKSKARLRLMAYSGLTQSQIMGLTTDDIDLRTPAVRLSRRKKGKGAAGGWRPLPEAARDALRGFLTADAGGRFSRDALRQSWQRACVKLGLPRSRPYDLRHSFGTVALEQTKNMHETQGMLGHRDARTTERYAAVAIPEYLKQAAAKVTFLRQPIVPEEK